MKVAQVFEIIAQEFKVIIFEGIQHGSIKNPLRHLITPHVLTYRSFKLPFYVTPLLFFRHRQMKFTK